MQWSHYTNKDIKEVFLELKTSPTGLTKKEAMARQEKYGLNELKNRGNSVLDILFNQFKSPFFYLLFIAALVSLFIGEKTDSVVILIFISINIFLGFFQEFRAEKTVSLLKNIIASKIKVIRDGKEVIIEKKDLVPGDIVHLVAGDIVPAELRITQQESLLVDQSVLTGESLPIVKTVGPLPKEEKEIFKANNILFTGTSVISGRAGGVVVSIGAQTALGQIAKEVSKKRPQGIYEKNLIYFCRLILKIVVSTVAVIFLLNLIIKGTNNFFEFSLFCVALVVSILPEALPAIVILALSRGSLKMAKENVVVKRLSAIEDLGNIEILCTDKTGTLTLNKLSLEKVVSFSKDKALLYGILSDQTLKTDTVGLHDEHKISSKDPFVVALLARSNYGIISDLKKFTMVKELSFDSFRMRSSVLVRNIKGEHMLITKGAPEVILGICSDFSHGYKKNEIKEDATREGQDGKRVLAIAYKKLEKLGQASPNMSKKDERAMTFLGYFVFEDPLKNTAEEAIRLSKKLGVKIKIITGDSKEVAGFVSKKTGLISNAADVILGEDLEKMQTDEFDNACQDNAVFARVSPDVKHKIIVSLQKKYEVGFLGEGINDVPALKAANVGIAVSEATDIAKEASDVVLLQKDLRVIVNGIKDGRVIFSNINKYIKCALANNFGNFYSIASISLFISFLPLLPLQILLGNLLSDFPLISIVTDSVDIEELRKPKNYQLHNVLPLIISLGLVSTLFDFVFFLIFYKNSPMTIQTLWFIETILTEIFLIFVIRTRHLFWKAKRPSFALLLFTIIDGLVIIFLPFTKFGQRVFHFAAPPLSGLFIILLLLIAYIGLSELVKLIYFHYFKPPKIQDN